VNGKAVTLPDGRKIQPEQVLGEYKAGTRMVVLGDVAETDSLVTYCDQADALVTEATYLESEAEMAQQFGHMTARQSAQLAVHANVKQLILTHLSRRYRERDILAEAQAVFPSTIVARDFDTFTVKKDE
jgi:ribonuclease Z